jgi:hypothetical protein
MTRFQRSFASTVIALSLVLAAGVAALHLTAQSPLAAQGMGGMDMGGDGFTEQQAIDLAAAHQAFVYGLENYPGWTAAAYDTRNAYGIWRVQFWDAEGSSLGWADVRSTNQRVYAWESYAGVNDAQRSAAEPVLREFLAGSDEILDLMDDPAQYDIYVDYDPNNRWWGVYIARGSDSMYVIVAFDDNFAFTNPRLLRIYFEIQSYDEWFAANEDLATSKAFELVEISEAVAGVEGWETRVERVEDAPNQWTVYFMLGDAVLAQATVDLDSNTILSYQVGEM